MFYNDIWSMLRDRDHSRLMTQLQLCPFNALDYLVPLQPYQSYPGK